MRYLRAAAVIALVVADAVAIIAGIILSVTAHFAWSLLAVGAAAAVAVAAWWQHPRTRIAAGSRVPRPPAIKPERHGQDPIDRHFTQIAQPLTIWPHTNPISPPRTTQTGDHE